MLPCAALTPVLHKDVPTPALFLLVVLDINM